MRNSLELLILLAVAGCSHSAPQESSPGAAVGTRPEIIVTSEPLLQMTTAIVKNAADVRNIVPTDATSRDWKPASDQIQQMQQADLILLSGAGYEPWRDRVSLPSSRMVDAAAGYYQQLIRIPDAVTHQHGPDGQHSHPGTVWATWLDPELCIAQLHLASVHCCKLLPDQKLAIESAEAKYCAEFKSLNAEITSIQEHFRRKFGDAEITVFSDAPHYQYLTQRLGWKLHYLQWHETEALSSDDRTALLEAFGQNADDSQLFLMSSRRSAEAEDFVRDSGGTVIRMDVCEFPSPDGTSLTTRLKQNLQRIRDAF